MMELENYHAFHFVGLGGVGMCALARILIEKEIGRASCRERV